MEKISIFVDVQNIYYTVKEKYNCHFNYRKFRDEVTHNRKLVKAIAYAIDKGDKNQLNFQNILRNIGFEIKLKPFIQRSDGSAKGDWDVGIALDIIEYAKKSDIIILASGDGDFESAVKKVMHENNVSVELYGVQGLTSSMLIDTVSLFVPIKGDLLLPIPEKW
ncbi:MAG: NYN domain-containing protein [Spirochaetes bacterium]|nr:NYN domain-containing protein [Spirochaetota bacterium]